MRNESLGRILHLVVFQILFGCSNSRHQRLLYMGYYFLLVVLRYNSKIFVPMLNLKIHICNNWHIVSRFVTGTLCIFILFGGNSVDCREGYHEMEIMLLRVVNLLVLLLRFFSIFRILHAAKAQYFYILHIAVVYDTVELLLHFYFLVLQFYRFDFFGEYLLTAIPLFLEVFCAYQVSLLVEYQSVLL